MENTCIAMKVLHLVTIIYVKIIYLHCVNIFALCILQFFNDHVDCQTYGRYLFLY